VYLIGCENQLFGLFLSPLMKVEKPKGLWREKSFQKIHEGKVSMEKSNLLTHES
jgi:hypothetical protein